MIMVSNSYGKEGRDQELRTWNKETRTIVTGTIIKKLETWTSGYKSDQKINYTKVKKNPLYHREKKANTQRNIN